jgi:photosystem II stability/assembly factor-like uncharacterized protein
VHISGIGTWPGGTVLDLAVLPRSGLDKDLVLAATFVGIYRSEDGGRHWHLAQADLPDWFIQAVVLAPMDDQVVALAASRMGWLYRSMDGGVTWDTISATRDMGVITRLVASPSFASDGVIFACTEEDGIFKSIDRGRTWRAGSFGLLNLSVVSLCFSPNFGEDEVVFAGTDSGGLFRSRNAGRAWRESGEGLPNSAVQCVAVSPNFVEDGTVFAGTEEMGLYCSVDGGRNWNPVVDLAADEPGALSGEACINSLYLMPDWATGGAMIAATDGGIIVSTDAGASWREAAMGPDYPYVVTRSCSELLVGAYDEGVYRSSDGDTWSTSNEGLAAHLPPVTVFSDDFARDHSLLMASMEGTIVRSEDGATMWTMLPQGQEESPGDVWGTVSLLASAGKGAAMSLLAASEADLAYSQDAGSTWQMLPGVSQESIGAVSFSQTFAQDGAMLVGTAGGRVLVSRDGGMSWAPRGTFEGEVVVALSARENEVYAVTARPSEEGAWQLTLRRGDLFSRGDGPWRALLTREASQPAAVLSSSTTSRLYCAVGERILCVSADDVIAESELDGAEQLSSLAVASDLVLAGSRTGLYCSTDGACSWECVSSEIRVVALHAVSPTQAYAVSMGGGLCQIDL